MRGSLLSLYDNGWTDEAMTTLFFSSYNHCNTEKKTRYAATRLLDERLLRSIRTRFHFAAADRWVARYSLLGEHGAVWLALGTAGAMLDRPRRARWGGAVAAVAGTYLLNTAIKQAVRRPRPRLAGVPQLTSTPTQLSFPSAHASTSFAGALVYARLGLPAGPLYALASSIALSRLYLGVHYPSDTLAGAALGTLVGALATGTTPEARL
jgi:membrane-associated phospholipid phosphatase